MQMLPIFTVSADGVVTLAEGAAQGTYAIEVQYENNDGEHYTERLTITSTDIGEAPKMILLLRLHYQQLLLLVAQLNRLQELLQLQWQKLARVTLYQQVLVQY